MGPRSTENAEDWDQATVEVGTTDLVTDRGGSRIMYEQLTEVLDQLSKIKLP